MEKKKRPLSWKPRRSGVWYCSPACGGGKFCTWENYRSAVRDSKALAESLGEGWVPRVWENLGWYYEAISPCRRIKVCSYSGSFAAYLGEAGQSGGMWVGEGRTPQAAVKQAVKLGQDCLARIGAVIEGL